jgi:hypothetical protein
MVRDRLLSITGGAVLMLLCAGQASADTACASSDGTWSDLYGTWALNQSSNGTITGTLTTKGGGRCPNGKVYAVTGRMGSSGGDFQYTAVYVGPNRPETCAQTIVLGGTIFKPGCNNSNGTFTNTGGGAGTFAFSTSCKIPTETTPSFVNWRGDGVNEPIARFTQDLTPASFNYGGRTLTETFQPEDTTDTCYFTDSAIPKVVTLPPKSISVSSNTPSGFGDNVGMTEMTVNYYRQHNVSPCGYYLKQRMKIDCDTSSPIYQVNDLEGSQGPFHVASGRGPTKVNKPWGAPPPARAVIPVIINFVLEQ